MKDRKELVAKLMKELDANPLVIGFVMVGSATREQNDIYSSDKYSDIEAYIIIKGQDTEKIERELVSIVKKLGKVIFSYKNRWAGFSTVFEDLFRLELPIVKQSEIASVFSRPKAQSIKVLIDKTNGELDKTLAKRPDTIDFTSIFKDEVEDFWYMSIVACQYYKRGELFNAGSALHITVSTLIKLLEMLQDQKILLMETNKRIENFLSKDQISHIEELTPPYDNEEIGDALRKSFDIFLNVAKEVSQKYDYSYDPDRGEEVRRKLLELLNN